MSEAPELAIIIPVYNEQASIRKVILEWFSEIENWTENFVFLIVNDGSTDGTAALLQRLRDVLGPRLEVINQTNHGHGQSCLAGYRLAVDHDIPYIFQIDSDGQCDPQYFFRFWRMREHYDAIYGIRKKRDDGWHRRLASWGLRLFILIFFRHYCADANVPYRLMRSIKIVPHLRCIPSDVDLANVGLAVLLRGDGTCRHGYVPIRFRERYGGEPTIRFSLFGCKAVELYHDIGKMLAK